MIALFVLCLALASDLAYGGTCDGTDHRDWADWCYHVPSTGKWSWAEADAYCKDAGMQLASIHSLEENSFIDYSLLDIRPNDNFWIGAIRTETLATESCSVDDHVIWGDWCYYVPPTEVFSWNAAEEYCHSVGMELASIHSREEMDFIYEYSVEARGVTNYWFGLIRDSDSFAWTDGTDFDYDNWSDGEPSSESEGCANLREDGTWNDLSCDGYELAVVCKGVPGEVFYNYDNFGWTDGTDFDYSNWDYGEPSDTSEKCVEFKNDGTWNDIGCDVGYELGVICKGYKWCEEGSFWNTESKSCITFVLEQKQWEAARDACQKDGDDLIKIVNEKMNYQIANQLITQGVDNGLWIGLNDRKTEGTWVWLDETEKTSYELWADDQPDNWLNNLPEEGQDCVEIGLYEDRAEWGDSECNKNANFICESPRIDPCGDAQEKCRQQFESRVGSDSLACPYAAAWVSCLGSPEVAEICMSTFPEDVLEIRDDKCYSFLT